MSTGRNTTTRDRDRRVIARTKPPCALCEEPIDYTLKWPDPMCFVVDHIQPIDSARTVEERVAIDALANKQAAHNKCNREKWHKVERKVVLICGPTGAGKTTLAHSLGLTVFDFDDPHWNGSDTLFRQAIGHLATDPNARAAVIRSAATLSARQDAANLCGATEVIVLDTDLKTCIEQIKDRGRTKPPLKAQIAAAQDWWSKYEAGTVTLATTSDDGPRTFVTARAW